MMKNELSIVIATVVCVHCFGVTKGEVAINPSVMTYVCNGGQIELTCTTTGRFLQWSSYLIPENATTARHESRLIDSQEQDMQNSTLRGVNSTVFTFSRISSPNSLPLMSRLLISSVTEGLNGTVINCRDRLSSNVSSTIIYVINEEQTIRLQECNITLQLEQLFSDNIAIVLECSLNSTIYSYYISVTPQAEKTLIFNNSTTVQLTLSYNTRYNVSVVATHPCGNTSVITSTELHYVTCGDPASMVDQAAGSVNIFGYSSPAVPGVNVSYACTMPELNFTGPRQSTCSDNGQWEPDPSSVFCLGTGSQDNPSTSLIPTILGVLFGIILVLTASVALTIIGVTMALRIYRRKRNITSSIERQNIYIDTETSEANITERNTDHQESNNATTRGLVYADLGQCHPRNKFRPRFVNEEIEYARINHMHTQGTAVQCVPEQHRQVETNLQEDSQMIAVNLDNLLIQLKPQVSPLWYQFGEAVGIAKEVLDNYAKQCTSDECIVETFDYWLRHCKEDPTWRDVAKILKTLKLDQLAIDIENVYTTGKLPIEIDMNTQICPEGLTQCLPSSSADELPPPIPKRSENSDFKMDNNSLDRKNDESSAPALPPKPTFDTDNPPPPPRPPKYTISINE